MVGVFEPFVLLLLLLRLGSIRQKMTFSTHPLFLRIPTLM
jgi:hypothetical protein